MGVMFEIDIMIASVFLEKNRERLTDDPAAIL
jgi:hypothetical protein